jgi:hypothetical protein
MKKSNIKFYEIEYNHLDNPTAERKKAIVTDSEYREDIFKDIDDKIFHYDMNEQYLDSSIELGSLFNNFIVYSYKQIKSVFEDTNQIENEKNN